MKLSQIFAIFLVIFVSSSAAQQCPGGPRNPICTGARDLGMGGRGCNRRTMWNYNPRTRRCEEFQYRGCGGNNNRWCTRAACEQRCRR